MLYGSASAFVGLLYGLKAFICMLVAGNHYFEGVMVVALAIGVIEALVTGYLSSSLRDAAAFFVLTGGGLGGKKTVQSDADMPPIASGTSGTK